MFEPKRHASQENEKTVTNMAREKLSSKQIQTAIFQSSGNLLSLSIINKVTQYSEDKINDDEFEGVFTEKEHETH